MIEKVASGELRVYFVWLPVLERDNEEAAVLASADFTDPRVRHFWNPDKELASAAASALHLERQLGEAWDVYMVYGPDAEWPEAELPAPTAWMHRVSAPADPRWMTPQGLAKVVRALLPERAAPAVVTAPPR